MPHVHKKHLIVSIIGSLFYTMSAIQWLWSSLPYLPNIMRFIETIQPTALPAKPVEQITVSSPPSGVFIAVVIVITIVVIIATIYALIKIPVTIGKTGKKITKAASNYIVPVISHHRPLTAQKRQWLTARIITDIKLALCIVPILIAALSYPMDSSLPYDIFMLITAVLASIALVLLGMQLVVMKYWRPRADNT